MDHAARNYLTLLPRRLLAEHTRQNALSALAHCHAVSIQVAICDEDSIENGS